MKIIFVALAMYIFYSDRSDAAEPLMSKCYSTPPQCQWGKQPLCICDDPYSYNCSWICVSPG